jgi:hypothetical protein
VFPLAALEVGFSENGSAATFDLVGASGAAVPLTPTWNDGHTLATLAPTLDVEAAYTLGVEVCGARTESAFTTVPELAVSAASLEGRVYVTRLSDATSFEPSILDFLASSYLTTPLLIPVLDASASSIELALGQGALADDGSYSVDLSRSPWSFGPTSFTDAPVFRAGPADGGALGYEDLAIPIEALTLAGAFSSDGEQIAPLVLSGLLDTRNLGELVGGAGESGVCDILLLAGISCEACADGEAYCVPIEAEMTATWEPTASW